MKDTVEHQMSITDDAFEVWAFYSRAILSLLEVLGVDSWIKIWRRAVGDPTKRLIYVNGKQFEITINLEMALRHLRQNTTSIRLWVDAICINQDDVVDRNNQVPGMRNMYRNANLVEIWLGYAVDITSKDTSRGVTTSFRDRFAPTISSDPRQGTSLRKHWKSGNFLTWNYLGEDTFESKTKTPTNIKKKDEYQLLKATKKQWRDYHNLPISRRAFMKIQPTEQCLVMIHQLAYHAFKKCNGGPNHKSLADRIVFLLKDSARSAVFKVFEEIVDASWWTRIWVVQETVIAEKVYVKYGLYRIQWDLLVRAAKNIEKHRQQRCCASCFERLPPEHIEKFAQFAEQVLSLETWRHVWQKKDPAQRKKIRLLTLLWRFRHRKTSNARDKVYALYSLVNNFGAVLDEQQGMGLLELRYDSTVSAVYRHTFNSILEMEDNLNILIGNARKSSELADELPTWIPDWSMQPSPGEYERLQRAELYSAYGQLAMSYKFLDVAHITTILRVRGIVLDRIKSVGKTMPEEKEKDEASVADAQKVYKHWATLAGLDENANEKAKNAPYGHPSFCLHQQPGKENLTLREAYGRLLCMDTKKANSRWDDDSNDYVNPYSRVDSKYDRAMGLHCGYTRSKDVPEMRSIGTFNARVQALADIGIEKKDTMQQDFALQVNETEKSAISERAFFLTNNGYMGLGPDGIKQGDIVAIVFGCSMPIIIRAAEPQHISEDPNDESHDYHSRPTSPLGHDNRQLSSQVDLTATPTREAEELQCEAGAELGPKLPPSRPTSPPPPVDMITPKPTITDVPNSNSQDKSTPVLPGLTDCFSLIGDAYVQGAMYGEAVENLGENSVFLHLV